MGTNRYLASEYQEGAVEQIAAHGWTYWRPLADRFRMSPAAANGVLGALTYKKLIAPFPLFEGTRGYRLTRFGCGVLEKPVSLARPRGEQSPVFRLARLVDCERRGVLPWQPEALAEAYPELAEFADLADRIVPGMDVELAVLHVDHGGSADRALARVNAIAARYLKSPRSNRLVLAGSLGVRVLTASRGKAEAIAKRILRAPADPLARLELDVVDDLQHLLAGRTGR